MREASCWRMLDRNMDCRGLDCVVDILGEDQDSPSNIRLLSVPISRALESHIEVFCGDHCVEDHRRYSRMAHDGRRRRRNGMG